jgi:geranylgeranyl diphosphate synthase type II
MRRELDACVAMVDGALLGSFSGPEEYQPLLDAMSYSLNAGGKRIRAVLTLQFAKAAGGDMHAALDAACAVEMLHAYSLIHDDLPCMDDSPLRRGKPSCHIVFGEWMATLAGDALQAAAFERVLRSPLPPERVSSMALTLARAAGPRGICGGQALDMSAEGKRLTVEQISRIHARKTAALFKACARMGVESAGGDGERVNAAERYAEALGLAFQIRDDVLDRTSDANTLGKPILADRDSGKNTFASLLGAEECERAILAETKKAQAALAPALSGSAFLHWLAQTLAERDR